MNTVNPSTSLRVNGERSRTIKFYTLGCKVNQYDTQVIREQFLNAGFKELEDSQPADIYVINTCTVTQTADRKSRQFIHYARRENPQAKIVVTGCYTELDSEKIAKIPGVTHIIKNKDKNRIVEYIDSNRAQLITHNLRTITHFKGHTRAFLKIQDGCDNFCSYCKVPLVRGSSRSKSLNEIIQEANQLVKNGFKEIVLSGICLGAYGRDLVSRLNLVNVIEAIEGIEGLWRIRLSSIEAGDVTEELIQKMAESKKLCPHLHIPIQSGDDEILKKMNRNYCRQDYLNLIKKIKNNVPEVSITTDVMVGFPGEDEENFQNTLNLIKAILPLKVHIFPYSPRQGTQAAINFKEKLNNKIIKERLKYLKNIAEECAFSFKREFLNKNMDVLIEAQAKVNNGYWQGYTDNYIKVLVKSSQNLKNQLISVKIKKIDKVVLADLR